jgi:hypothetical protein
MRAVLAEEAQPRTQTTADLAAAAIRSEQVPVASNASPHGDGDRETQPERQLALLFPEGTAAEYRARWNIVQQGFVDSPQNAVREGDELVAQVIKGLAETFAEQRATLEGAHGSTEDLRLALRRYRSFFERLLSI